MLEISGNVGMPRRQCLFPYVQRPLVKQFGLGQGVAKAKAEGKYRGRAPTAQAKAREVVAMLASGKGPTEVAEALKIGRSSVYRVIRSLSLRKMPTAYVSAKVDQASSRKNKSNARPRRRRAISTNSGQTS